jgi:hypothetical protein
VIGRRNIAKRGIVAASLALICLPAVAGGASLEQMSVGTDGTGNSNNIAPYAAVSADGTRVFFESPDRLAPNDTDGNLDVYERSNGVTTLLSIGPNGGNGNQDVAFRGISADGAHVFFHTGEALVASDADGRCHDDSEGYRACVDVYERFDGQTYHVSTSPTSANADVNSRFRGTSLDGRRVFFSSPERLVAADTDDAVDVYERFNGATSLVSTGPADGNAYRDAFFKGASDAGGRVFIETQDRLTADDTDSEADIYERAGGATTLLSTGPAGGNGPFGSSFKGNSSNGARVVFETDEQLTTADTDNRTDVYERNGSVTTLLSTGPGGGNGAVDAFLAAFSRSGARAWIETNESLVAGDADGRRDVYERSGSTTTLVSTGPSGGSGAFDAHFQGASEDGSRVWIGTFERLAPTDTDSVFDIYERFSGTAVQVSLGTGGGNGAFDSFFSGATPDGSRVFIETLEPLVGADTDTYMDAYQRYGGNTTLVTTGPSGTPTAWSSFLDVNDNGTRVIFESADKLLTQDTDTRTDIYAWLDTGIYPRPRGATPLQVPLVIAYRDCTSANSMHGAPLSHPSCTPPVPSSDWLRVGTPDANFLPVRSVGSVWLKTVVGDSGTAADEADLRLLLEVNDVRKKSDLTDYAGEVELRLAIRLTDRLSGSAPVDPGTVMDFPFGFTVTCTPTADTDGSRCSANTTADAIVPGVIVEERRTIWQVGAIELYDGGSDGDVSTAPNTLFERQGVFIP